MIVKIALIALLVEGIMLLISYLAYMKAFHINKKSLPDMYDMPKGDDYDGLVETTHKLIDGIKDIPYESVYIKSVDGLKLHAKYYHVDDNAPIELCMHGYKGVAERDFCGGITYALEKGNNVLHVDQRAQGKSEGACVTMGIMERHDCISWIKYILQRFGTEKKIILVGVSMGAAAVLMAGGTKLPPNVIGIIADCGYNSPVDIVKYEISKSKLLAAIVYPFVLFGGSIFGGFDLKEESPENALKNCEVPVLFIHGEADKYVPCEMSIKNYEVCNSEKYILTVPGAPHGMSYIVDYDAYNKAASSFLDNICAKEFTPFTEDEMAEFLKEEEGPVKIRLGGLSLGGRSF